MKAMDMLTPPFSFGPQRASYIEMMATHSRSSVRPSPAAAWIVGTSAPASPPVPFPPADPVCAAARRNRGDSAKRTPSPPWPHLHVHAPIAPFSV